MANHEKMIVLGLLWLVIWIIGMIALSMMVHQQDRVNGDWDWNWTKS